MELRPHLLTAARALWYSEFDRNHEISPCWSLPVLYPQRHIWRRQPKSCFGENQLFPGSISFSLLTTSHPNALYDVRVRASMRLSTHFTLLMVSSPGFGSYVSYDPSISLRTCALLTLGFPTAPPRKGLATQDTYTRRLILQ